MKPEINFMLDSGAHTLYNKHVRTNHSALDWDFSYSDTDWFWEYAEHYAKYLKETKDKYEVYVSLDVIRSPQKSWEMQKWFESQGLNPLPVFHFGEPVEWLKKYMDNYEYFGISGLGQEIQRENYVAYADRVFNLICDKEGYPKWKIHGFALTSVEMILRYPFYSVDSTTWLAGEKYSLIGLPLVRNGQFDYSKPPRMISVTSRRTAHTSKPHIKNLPKELWLTLFRLCEEAGGLPWGKSKFYHVDKDYKVKKNNNIFWADMEDRLVEEIVEPGISNSMDMRNAIWAYYFTKVIEHVNNNPRRFDRNDMRGFYD